MRIALAAAAALLALAGPAFAAVPVALRASPLAHGAAVTLADLFDGASGWQAETVVAPAAAPGGQVVLDAGRVQLAAQRAGFAWDNPQGLHRILVGTAPSGAPVGAAAHAARGPQALAWARNIAAGEIIQPADLVWSDKVIAGADAPGDPDGVIGQAARHPIRAGAAVQRSDTSAPVVIHRNEMIEIVFSAPGIHLALQGQALKDAAVGEPVQVLNPSSKKVIEAVASGPGKAVVGPAAEALKARPFVTASIR
jgi:flagella basal body P-ring formation protein FlgA